jgi:heptosyltransferase II
MNRILIIAPNWIGDAVMSQPLLANLKARYPHSQIDVLASTWVAPIYRACTQINHVIEAKLEHKKLQWSLRKQLAKELQAKNYEACFVLPNSLKSALIPWLANIPFRFGYRGEMRFGLINFALENPSKVNRPPMVEHYYALASLLESDSTPLASASCNPILTIPNDAKHAMQSRLASENINSAYLYVFCPGAEYGPSKRWPTEHFAKLAQAVISENQNAQIILLGSKADYNLGQQVLEGAHQHPQLHNWCGSTSLDEAIALIASCKTLVSNDSGLMHIGAALHIPQVAIFGSSDPQHTPPLSDRAKMIWLDLPCSPCHKRECPLGHLKCLNDISPEKVLHTISLLR